MAKKKKLPKGAKTETVEQGRVMCPECGILNDQGNTVCDVCKHPFKSVEEQIAEMQPGSKLKPPEKDEGVQWVDHGGEIHEGSDDPELEKLLYDLNKDLMVAISEENEGAIEEARDQIASAVRQSQGKFVLDDEGYAEEKGRAQRGAQLTEEGLEMAKDTDTKTLLFKKEKETKNTVRFAEVVEEGSPPVVTTLYVQKWWVGDADNLGVTITKE